LTDLSKVGCARTVDDLDLAAKENDLRGRQIVQNRQVSFSPNDTTSIVDSVAAKRHQPGPAFRSPRRPPWRPTDSARWMPQHGPLNSREFKVKDADG
jgi:hypothetical protein